MKNHNISMSLLLTALMAVGGAAHAAAHTQGAASGTSDVPAKAGEISTTTKGVPNAKTTNAPATGTDGAMPATRAQVRQDASNRAGASGTSSVPSQAGELSTTVNGRPNANPEDPMVKKSAAERRSEREMKRAERRTARDTAVMGQKGATAGAPAGTPAISPAGTPPVQAGGTAK